MNHRQLSERIQAAARAVGLPGVLLVGGANGGVNGVTQNAKTWGYSAYFIYTYAAGLNGLTRRQPRVAHSYAEFDENYREQWAWFMKNTDLPYVLPMSSGFDRRPWGGSTDPQTRPLGLDAGAVHAAPHRRARPDTARAGQDPEHGPDLLLERVR